MYWHKLKTIYGGKLQIKIPVIIKNDQLIFTNEQKCEEFIKCFSEKSKLPDNNNLPELPHICGEQPFSQTMIQTSEEK